MSCPFARLSRFRGYLGLALLGAFALLPAVGFAAATSTATVTAAQTPALRINEVLATNTKIANGSTFPDLIELHNAGPAAVDLGGKSLTDDPLLPRKFTFPVGTTLPAGGYLVVYADTVTSAPGLHTGFALDAEGDQVRLIESAAAGGALIDAVTFGFQIPDYSMSRTGAGSNIWTLTTPTFGAANAPATALGSPDAVKLNEWAGRIVFRLDHDLIELFNTAALPVAISGLRLTDDATRPDRFTFPPLSFIAPTGFLPLYGADFGFGLDGDNDPIFLIGENGAGIDQVALLSQPRDTSNGRSPDGGPGLVSFAVPTPGFSNQTPLPPAYAALLANLRITEIMYQPQAASGSSDYEFIELQNIGNIPLDLSGVRFTNGIDYTFDAGTTLAAGGVLVVVNDRSSFLSRYPNAAAAMAPRSYSGALDNTGETLALTLPAPWRVHILRFRFESSWFPQASGEGHSIVVTSPATTAPQDWLQKATWSVSPTINGSPGVVEAPTGGSDSSRLSNLSVRTALAANQTLTVGFVVSGGTRTVLARAAGPGLTELGLGGAMADPRLQLYNGSALAVENDNWPASLADTFASVSAFPFRVGSADAALVRSVDRDHSLKAAGPNAGVVLVEVYDTGGTNAARLVNVSALNRVGTGDDILIAGFNISGPKAKRLLLRAIGPGLAPFRITTFLVDPQLAVFRGSTVIAENDNWNATLAATFESVSAFALAPNSSDAALIATLEPGSYTAQVRGRNEGTGDALIEIYELP